MGFTQLLRFEVYLSLSLREVMVETGESHGDCPKLFGGFDYLFLLFLRSNTQRLFFSLKIVSTGVPLRYCIAKYNIQNI